MLNQMRKDYERLLHSKVFEKCGFLCGLFVMASPEDIKNAEWQFDFYDEKKERMTSYLVNDEIRLVEKNAEVFKNGSLEIERLDLDEVMVGVEEALKRAEVVLKEKGLSVSKVVITLQKSKEIFWNVSFLTTSFNLLNVRLSGRDGSLLEESVVSLMDFRPGVGSIESLRKKEVI